MRTKTQLEHDVESLKISNETLMELFTLVGEIYALDNIHDLRTALMKNRLPAAVSEK